MSVSLFSSFDVVCLLFVVLLLFQSFQLLSFSVIFSCFFLVSLMFHFSRTRLLFRWIFFYWVVQLLFWFLYFHFVAWLFLVRSIVSFFCQLMLPRGYFLFALTISVAVYCYLVISRTVVVGFAGLTFFIGNAIPTF